MHLVSFAFAVLLTLPQMAHAASLTFVRDTITDSGLSATSTHTIEFTATNPVPASGKIFITPEASRFYVYPTFSYTDADLAVASGMSFVERDLAASPSATEDGLAVVTGTSGSFTFTLNSTAGIAAGERVRVVLGEGASFGATGSSTIRNHSAKGSYRIGIRTTDSSETLIDQGTAMIAVVPRVTMRSAPEAVAPTRSNGLPSGEIAADSSNVELSLQTNIPAACRYSATAGTPYASMTGAFVASDFGRMFSTVVTGLVNDTTYTYYVRCNSQQNITNTDDYVISFKLKPTAAPSGSGSGGAAVYLGSGGSGPYPGGSSLLYLSNVTLSGWSAPNSTVRVVRDGTVETTVQAGTDGAFRAEVIRLERGVYTFLTSSTDSAGRTTGRLSTTLTLSAGTTNTITDLLLPPAFSVEGGTVDIGDDLVVAGSAVPGGAVTLLIAPESAPEQLKTYAATTSATGARAGAWSITVPGASLSRGVYLVRARVALSSEQQSDTSPTLRVGIGQVVAGGMRSDLNKDGKVNLVDFSILLTSWGASGAGDINEDGTTNLADFSIMLFDWTG